MIASRIDKLDAAMRELERSARPPMWNRQLASVHLMAKLERWEASRTGERMTMTMHMRWEGTLRAPIYADRQALREQRLLHALIVWSVELTLCVYGKHAAATMKRGAIAFAISISALTLSTSIVADYLPQRYAWVTGVVGAGIGVYWTVATALSFKRTAIRAVGVGERLHRQLSSVGLRCVRVQSRESSIEWLQARWAGDLDRDDVHRGESTMVISGGADAQGDESEALVYVRGGVGCRDIVVYLPMIDVDGAIEPPAEIARSCAQRLLAELRRRGWAIEEERAGIYATRFIDDTEAMTSAQWGTLAADVGGLLELPAGLGLLSSSSARSRLAASGVTIL